MAHAVVFKPELERIKYLFFTPAQTNTNEWNKILLIQAVQMPRQLLLNHSMADLINK